MEVMKRLQKLFVALAMMLLPLAASAQATLSIEKFDIKAGEEKEMVIDLTNPGDEITLVQFDLRLPDGLQLKQVGGEYDIDMCDRTTWRRHSLDANATEGIIRFLLASSSNTVIDGTEGAIIKMTLVASSGFDGGTICLENILMVSPDEKETKQETLVCTIAPASNPVPTTSAYLSIAPGFNIHAGEEKEMVIDLTNPEDEITLVQFDLRLPDGLQLKQAGGEYDIDMCDRTTWRRHSLDANETEGIIRFLLASSSNTVISGTEGALIEMTLTASNSYKGDDIRVEHILLVTPDEKEIKPADIVYKPGGSPETPDTIYIAHVPDLTDTLYNGEEVDISEYQAMKLDDILNDYCADKERLENTVFCLEGGKAYFISGYVSIYKGLTLCTNPEDVAKGLRAKLYLNGMTMDGRRPRTGGFMLGRYPNEGEDASISIDIDAIRFADLDVDVPLANNYGHQEEGIGEVYGNYFMNMYSNTVGLNVNTLEWRNCSFQGLIRGFLRLQGQYERKIHHLRLIGCDFYNCGHFQATGYDYGYITADHFGEQAEISNHLEDVEVAECVFYDNPKSGLIKEEKNVSWGESVRWQINVHHNTFVNFSTNTANPIMSTHYIPGGSVLEFHDNVIILTKDAADVNRPMLGAGWRTNSIQGGDGSGQATFIIHNNWTTNDQEYLTNGQPFTSYAFNSTSNAPGKWFQAYPWMYPYGEYGLTVYLNRTLTATELMVSPNPQHFIGNWPSHLDHHTDTGINGLYYRQTDKVKNSDIYKSGAGCQRLVKGLDENLAGVAPVSVDDRKDSRVYSLSGQRLAAPKKGINIVGGRKVVVR